MKEIKKENNGITLIALVVTIIVLLILAGISINVLLGDNGILKMANSAKKNTEIAEIEERVKFLKGDWYLDRRENPLDNRLSDFWNTLVKSDIIKNPEEDVTKIEDGLYELKTKKGYSIRVKIDEDEEMVVIQNGDTIWENGQATVELKSSISNVKIEYKINDGKWVEYNKKITGLKHGDKIVTRLKSKINTSEEKTITVLDNVIPTCEIIIDVTEATTDDVIPAKITQNDYESGIDIAKCKWIYNTTSNEIGTNENDYTKNFENLEQNITIPMQAEPGTYFLHVLTVDTAGNKKESISNGINTVQLMKNLTLSVNDDTLNPTVTAKCLVNIEPQNTSNKDITWSSSDNNIATIDSNGIVTAHNVGTATITVTANDKSQLSSSVKINVIQSPILKQNNVVKASYRKNGISWNDNGVNVELTISLTDHVANNADKYEITLQTENGLKVLSSDNVIEGGSGSVSLSYLQPFDSIEEVTIYVNAINEGGLKVPISGKVYTTIGPATFWGIFGSSLISSGISMERPASVDEGINSRFSEGEEIDINFY